MESAMWIHGHLFDYDFDLKVGIQRTSRYGRFHLRVVRILFGLLLFETTTEHYLTKFSASD